MDGAVIWRGPSLLTGDPIFVVVTGLGRVTSKNTKTGPMAQVWILREDIAPTEAVNTGGDDAICGNCRHRSGTNVGRSCYVIWWTAPMAIWKAYRQREVERMPFEQVIARPFRISAYGDQALGWRTFRVRREHEPLDGDIVCPASEEAGMRTTCAKCRLCQGTSTRAKSIAILPHGQRVKWLKATT